MHRKPQTVDEDRLLDALCWCCVQACSSGGQPGNPRKFDSVALSSYAEALRLLAEYGRVWVEQDFGRIVVAHDPEPLPEMQEVADDFALEFISNHTKIPIDSNQYRALVAQFEKFGRLVLAGQPTPKKEGGDVPSA